MLIPLSYQIFGDYFSKKISWKDLKIACNIAFQNAIQIIDASQEYKYYQLQYKENSTDKPDINSDYYRSKIIKSASKLSVYNYFLFDCKEEPFNECINYWLNNNLNKDVLKMLYTVDNLFALNLYNIDGIEYVDLMEIFDYFFWQNDHGYFFRLVELGNPIVEL